MRGAIGAADSMRWNGDINTYDSKPGFNFEAVHSTWLVSFLDTFHLKLKRTTGTRCND